MLTRSLMFQGTGSDVGKSMLVAGLCRAAANRGLRVAPFKPQNMSNNAAVSLDGGEIGRAQWLQAFAARVDPSIHMNPVLLKPQTSTGAQVVVQGKVLTQASGRDYQRLKQELFAAVLESYEHIRDQADLVLIEGAGSPAEINLRKNDIANMGFATATNTPVILVGDVDRGGVIASLVGTHAVLSEQDRNMVEGFIINKFRGDMSLFDDATIEITNRTGWNSFGIVPWFDQASKLPAEDSVGLEKTHKTSSGKIKIVVPIISLIANFDDFDPLIQEPDVELVMVEPGSALPGDCALIILPGSKSTIADLAFLRANGWDIDIQAHVRRGGRVMGICGGYQMLGQNIHDPARLEGTQEHAKGLELLNITTTLEPQKVIKTTNAISVRQRMPVEGYEIHMGRTIGPDTGSPLLMIDDVPDGAISSNGLVFGCYMHGIFTADKFRRAFLNMLGASIEDSPDFKKSLDKTLDDLAAHLEKSLDVDGLLTTASS